MMQYNTIYSSNGMKGQHATPMIAKNLVSPLCIMTPKTQQLYYFGESASSDLNKVGNIFDRVKPINANTSTNQQPLGEGQSS